VDRVVMNPAAPEVPADLASPGGMTRVGPADLASPADTIPGATTPADLPSRADTIPADLPSRADTIPADLALLGRTAGLQDPVGPLLIRMPAGRPLMRAGPPMRVGRLRVPTVLAAATRQEARTRAAARRVQVTRAAVTRAAATRQAAAPATRQAVAPVAAATRRNRGRLKAFRRREPGRSHCS
jgi:hypothetical protein